jgi:hypothetical protein
MTSFDLAEMPAGLSLLVERVDWNCSAPGAGTIGGTRGVRSALDTAQITD